MNSINRHPAPQEKRMHEKFMQQALMDARLALHNNEFPVGCVITFQERIIARGQRIKSIGDGIVELDHAEIMALRNLQMSGQVADMRLTTIYSTMEPCLMCYATILLNGLGRIVYAYEDIMGGSTSLSLEKLAPLYQTMKVEIVPHVLRAESLSLMKLFFKNPQNSYWQDSLLARYTLEQK